MYVQHKREASSAARRQLHLSIHLEENIIILRLRYGGRLRLTICFRLRCYANGNTRDGMHAWRGSLCMRAIAHVEERVPVICCDEVREHQSQSKTTITVSFRNGAAQCCATHAACLQSADGVPMRVPPGVVPQMVPPGVALMSWRSSRPGIAIRCDCAMAATRASSVARTNGRTGRSAKIFLS